VKDESAIYAIPTELERLEATDTSVIVGILGESVTSEQTARRFRARVTLEFPDFQYDPRPLERIGLVRRFIQELDRQIPHFPFFLLPDPVIREVLSYVLCLVSETESPQIFQDEFMSVIGSKMEAVAAFARRVNVDEEDAIEGLYLALPAEHLSVAPNVAQRAIAIVRPILLRIAEGPTDSGHKDAYLQWVVDLTGIQRGEYSSDSDYVAAVLKWKGV